MPSKPATKSAPKKAPEPDWKAIATILFQDVLFATNHLSFPGGSGTIYNSETGEMRHWKTRFADSLELVPGVKIDREAMFAMGLPKKQRAKWFKDREEAAKKRRRGYDQAMS